MFLSIKYSCRKTKEEDGSTPLELIMIKRVLGRGFRSISANVVTPHINLAEVIAMMYAYDEKNLSPKLKISKVSLDGYLGDHKKDRDCLQKDLYLYHITDNNNYGYFSFDVDENNFLRPVEVYLSLVQLADILIRLTCQNSTFRVNVDDESGYYHSRRFEKLRYFLSSPISNIGSGRFLVLDKEKL